jgi:hypothetical protein
VTWIAAALRPDLPALRSEVWEPTKTTVHLWVQIVGKVKLATTAPRNHWWNVPLYLDVRGLTTRRLHRGRVGFQIDFDFVDHRLLVRTNRGKQSPVHLFWHSLDLAVTRFSGRRAPPRAGADPVTREAYSHEVISFGFWAGDDNTHGPAFYSYTAPEPSGLTDQPMHPASAVWRPGQNGSMALLGYDQLRDAHDPRTMLLAFLHSSYDAGAHTGGWDHEELTSSFCPTGAELQALHQRATTP